MDVPRGTIAGTLLPGETSTAEVQMENMAALSEIVAIGVEDGYLIRRDPAWNWTSPTHSHIFFKTPLLSITACSSRLCRSIPLLQVHISYTTNSTLPFKMRSISTIMALITIGGLANCAPVSSSAGNALAISDLLPRDADSMLMARKEVSEYAAEQLTEDSKIIGTDDREHQNNEQHGKNGKNDNRSRHSKRHEKGEGDEHENKRHGDDKNESGGHHHSKEMESESLGREDVSHESQSEVSHTGNGERERQSKERREAAKKNTSTGSNGKASGSETEVKQENETKRRLTGSARQQRSLIVRRMRRRMSIQRRPLASAKRRRRRRRQGKLVIPLLLHLLENVKHRRRRRRRERLVLNVDEQR